MSADPGQRKSLDGTTRTVWGVRARRGDAQPSAGPAGELAAQLRRIERKRRQVDHQPWHGAAMERYCLRCTVHSFRLDQLEISEAEAAEALRSSPRHRAFRPPKSQRIRNHVAILRWTERLVACDEPVKVATVIRWYTSVSCGLSLASLDSAATGRLERILQRANSPQLRLRIAVADAAGAYASILREPLFPSFNGVLARLLLNYQLRKGNLAPVVFDSAADASRPPDERLLIPRLLDLVEREYEGGSI